MIETQTVFWDSNVSKIRKNLILSLLTGVALILFGVFVPLGYFFSFIFCIFGAVMIFLNLWMYRVDVPLAIANEDKKWLEKVEQGEITMHKSIAGAFLTHDEIRYFKLKGNDYCPDCKTPNLVPSTLNTWYDCPACEQRFCLIYGSNRKLTSGQRLLLEKD